MPPIRTFNSAPINQNTAPTAAKHEDNVTPPEQDDEQAEQQQQQQSTPFAAPATTTTIAASKTSSNNNNNNINPPAARPGAYAVPGPTAAPVPVPTKTYPSSFDANTHANTNNPPAPQPGARPVPSTTTSKTAYTVPPPPKTGEPVQPAAYYAPKAETQQTQQSNTSTAGYNQTQSGLMGSGGGGGMNTLAQEEGILSTPNIPNSTSTPYMSTYQPPSAQPLPSTTSRFAGIVGNANSNSNANSSSNNAGPLYAGNDNEDSILGESGQKVYETAKSWMQSAGNKLAEAEAEVWKMVNSK